MHTLFPLIHLARCQASYIVHDGRIERQNIERVRGCSEDAKEATLTKNTRAYNLSQSSKMQLAIDIVPMAVYFELYGRSKILDTPTAATLLEERVEMIFSFGSSEIVTLYRFIGLSIFHPKDRLIVASSV